MGQGNNKKWLRESLKKCHATEVDIHNKWVQCNHKGKMNLELCRRAGKVALKMEENKCSRVKTRAALAERSSNVALTMCKRSAKRLETRAALSARPAKLLLTCAPRRRKSTSKQLRHVRNLHKHCVKLSASFERKSMSFMSILHVEIKNHDIEK